MEDKKQSFKIVGEGELSELEKKKKKVDEVMDIVKACGLHTDEEFMAEIQEAIDASLE